MRNSEFKYYHENPWDGEIIHAFSADGSQDSYIKEGMVLMVDSEVDEFYSKKNNVVVESMEIAWVESEMEVVKEQLLRLEDDDPSALPGTERQWRDYRIALRAWKPGAEGFPYQNKRPKRPQ